MSTDHSPRPAATGGAVADRRTGPLGRWPQLSDGAIAVLVFLIEVFGAVAGLVGESGSFSLSMLADIPGLTYVLLAVGSAALLWRRNQPLPVLFVALGASFVWDVIGLAGGPSLAILISLYGVGRYVAEPRTRLSALVAAIVIVIADDLIEREAFSTVGLSVALVVLAWYVGLRTRGRREYLELLEERMDSLERERLAEARRAVAEERTRIARELHDLVAHRVSMMTVQAGAAQTVVETDPQRAMQAMHSVEEAGRDALDELREILGVLRSEGGQDARAPIHGLSEIPDLVERVKEAGVQVDLTMDAVPHDVSTKIDLAAYRIVQEALTNVVKHAGPDSSAAVSVRAGDGAIAIDVADDGRGGQSVPGSGHGLAGMRERATLLGGTFEAGPDPDGGFRVRARLPMGSKPI